MWHADSSAGVFGAVDLLGLHSGVLEALGQMEPDDHRWRQVFAVFTGDGPPADAATPAIAGRYSVQNDRARFTPAFPPIAGQSYYARVDVAALDRLINAADAHAGPAEPARQAAQVDAANAGQATAVVSAVIDTVLMIPKPGGAPASQVVAVFPSVDRVPVNLLRLYVHFSAPMSIGRAYDRMRLMDDDGNVVEDAFLNVPEELWDPDRTRLTVLFDPGRIKRDLRPNQELGLPLEEGREYTLVIDGEWLDADDRPLRQGFQKTFVVGPEDRTAPSADDWSLDIPAAGTRDALIVDFAESLDHALAQRLLSVADADGAIITGEVAVIDAETRWRFVPRQNWRPGPLTLRVGTEIEDLAGNNLLGLFDVDRDDPRPTGVSGETVTRSFVIHPE